jgi:hypothetical protein
LKSAPWKFVRIAEKRKNNENFELGLRGVFPTTSFANDLFVVCLSFSVLWLPFVPLSSSMSSTFCCPFDRC